MSIDYDQYQKAFPKITYDEPPGLTNGYGWAGNGYGWQLDPEVWKPTPADEPDAPPPEDDGEEVEEQEIQVKKVEKAESFCSRCANNGGMASAGKRTIGRAVEEPEGRTVMAAQAPRTCAERVGKLPITARLSDDGSDLTCDRVRRLIKSRAPAQEAPKHAQALEKRSHGVVERAREKDGERENHAEHKKHVEKQNEVYRHRERETPRERERRRARERERAKESERQRQKEKERERWERTTRKVVPPPGPKRTSKNVLVRDTDSRTSRMWKFRDDRKNDPKLADGGRINARERDRMFRTKIRTSVVKRLGFDPYYIYHFGERGSGIRHHGGLQDFYQIRDQHLDNGTLFEDPQFPCEDQSLYFSHRPNYRVEWLRPTQISNDPRLFVEGFSRFDVQQGELGDCWLLAAVANLTMYHRLFFQVVPDDQSFYDKYAGVFHFRFWQYGRWIDVVIDDRLPTRHGQLLFLRSSTENEFWSALLEKAYAKLHGSYEALKGGSTCEAMEDFTGGVTEMYELNAAPADLYKIMLKAFERGSLMGCSIEPDPHELEARTADGLVKGHAYSITKVKFVEIQTPNTRGKIPLLRLRNPWGDDTEWNGAWSDQSPEWRFIPDAEKNELGLTFDSDGEFWMSYKDFVSKFDRIELCNLNPDSLDQNSTMKKWEVSYYEGSWVRGVTAGGCRNFIDTFANNPQYRITLTETDEEENDGKCTIIVALMQKNRRSKRRMGLEELSIGFVLYYIRDPSSAPKPLDRNFFKHNAIVARCPSYINLREVSCRFRLSPGTYCIVPSTFDPDEEGEFLLRVYSEHQNNMEYGSNHVDGGDDAPTYRPPSPPSYRPPTPPPRNPRSINAGGFGGFGDFGLGGGGGGHGGGIGGFLNDILNSRFSFNFQQPGGGQGSSQAQAGQQHTTPYPPPNQAPYPAYPQGGAPPYPTQPAPYPQQPNMPYPQQPPYPPQPGYPPQQYPGYPPQPPYPGYPPNRYPGYPPY